MNQREAALEEGVEGGEDFRGRFTRLGGYGLDLQRLRQPLNGGIIDRSWRRGLAQRFALEAHGVERQNDNERKQQDRCNDPDLLESPQKSTLS